MNAARHIPRLGALALMAGLMACGPVPVEQAERQCLHDAELAQRPRGTIGIGIGSGGRVAGNVSLEVSGDYLMGRDPAQVYASCVYRRSGQMPRAPLWSQPGQEGAP